MIDPDLIPCDDELNRLKEQMAEIKAWRIADEAREAIRARKRWGRVALDNRLEIWIENQCSSGT